MELLIVLFGENGEMFKINFRKFGVYIEVELKRINEND